MKKSIIYLAMAALLFSSCNNSSKKVDQTCSTDSAKTSQTFLDTTKLKSGDVFYQCSMHTEVLSNKAGSCPKCGMILSAVIKN